MNILSNLFSPSMFQQLPHTSRSGNYTRKGPGRKRDNRPSDRTELSGEPFKTSKLARKFMRRVATKHNF